MAKGAFFTERAFRFLKELAANNTREWFAENKARYEEDLKVPALRFIEAFAGPLADISPHFHAGPRSLFRIHRDTRFSKDKSPYKTHVGVQFRHDRSKDVHAPGYYFHLEPGSCFVALGMWHPEPAALRRVRDRIAEEGTEWRRAIDDSRMRKTFELEGDRLSRVPKGFPADHPMAEDLKWKDFIAVRRVPQTFVTDPGLPGELAGLYGRGTPLMKFLCSAVQVPF